MGCSHLSTEYTAISMGVQGTKGSSLSPWPPSPSSPVSEFKETAPLIRSSCKWASSLGSLSLSTTCNLALSPLGSKAPALQVVESTFLHTIGSHLGVMNKEVETIGGRAWSPGSSWFELWFRRCKYVSMVASFTSFLFTGAC